MTSWFGKKKPQQSIEAQTTALIQELEALMREHADLTIQLDDLKDSTQRNQMMLDEFISNAAHYDASLEHSRQRMQSLEGAIKTCEKKIQLYQRENQALREQIESRSDDYVKQNNADQSIQEILDAVESHDEQIFFRDARGALWEIVKRDDVELPLIEGEEALFSDSSSSPSDSDA